MPLRLIVTGPRDFDDFNLVKKTCEKMTFRFDNAQLLQDVRPNKDHAMEENMVYFPLGLKWFRWRWRRDRGFDTTVYFHNPYTGKKQWDRGQKEQRMEMLRCATAMIAFWAVGEGDDHTEELIDLAKLFDINLRVIRV